jgi:FkbM family methyltransferase
MTHVIIGAMDGVSYDDIFDRLSQDDVALFIEPIPYQFDKLKENVKKLRCQVLLDNSAISDRKEDLVMAYVPPKYLKNHEDFIRGCSSVVKFNKPLNRYLAEIDESNLEYHETKAISFDTIMDKWGLDKVDYVQVDCEGYDQKIVDSIDLIKYNIKTLKFEIHYVNLDFINYFSQKWPQYKPTIKGADIIYEYTF